MNLTRAGNRPMMSMMMFSSVDSAKFTLPRSSQPWHGNTPIDVFDKVSKNDDDGMVRKKKTKLLMESYGGSRSLKELAL